jgi:hypothetical protein
VEDNADDLFNSSGPHFRATLDAAWESVKNECVELGFIKFVDKTTSQLRNDLFAKKRTEILKRYDGWVATGKGSHRPWKKVWDV